MKPRKPRKLTPCITRVVLACCACMLAACSATNVAQDSGLTRTDVSGPPFVLATWSKGLGGPASALHIYIEGDGRAFTGSRVSNNPTPRKAIGLRLASADPSPAVLYIARPCQFTKVPLPVHCSPRFWSNERYSETVLGAIEDVIQWAHRKWKQASLTPPPVVLVGFSGGGTIATLLADRDYEIFGLVTVAANLDLSAWTTHHGVAPLDGSLNPADLEPTRKSHLRQHHHVGSADTVVPRAIVESYIAKRGLAPSAMRIHAGFNHECCWESRWPELVCEVSPQC